LADEFEAGAPWSSECRPIETLVLNGDRLARSSAVIYSGLHCTIKDWLAAGWELVSLYDLPEIGKTIAHHFGIRCRRCGMAFDKDGLAEHPFSKNRLLKAATCHTCASEGNAMLDGRFEPINEAGSPAHTTERTLQLLIRDIRRRGRGKPEAERLAYYDAAAAVRREFRWIYRGRRA